MTDESDVAQARQRTYEALRRTTGEDNLHQLIARDGLEVLDSEIPYLVRRLRWLAMDRRRRQRREEPTEPSRLPLRSIDPAAMISQWSQVGDALLSLQESDSALLWWAAAGYSTAEQRDLWSLANYDPPNISEAALRQRLRRARQQLRDILDPPER